MAKMKIDNVYKIQANIDLTSDVPPKHNAGSLMAEHINDFRDFIEKTDWDRRLLKKYGKAVDIFCWGVVIVSVLFFFHISLSILAK